MKPRLFLIAIFILFTGITNGQDEYCYPYGEITSGSTQCENAFHLCGDKRHEFCFCPYGDSVFINAPWSRVVVFSYSFDVTGPGQSVTIDVGDWTDYLNVYGDCECEIEGPFYPDCEWNEINGDSTLVDSVFSSSNPDHHSKTWDLPNVPGRYYVFCSGYVLHGISIGSMEGCPYVDVSFTPEMTCRPCSDCISTFSPEPGKKYVLSAWAKEDGAAATKLSYDRPQIYVDFPSLSSSEGPFTPSGHIIDGWQRIEAEIEIPANATDIDIRLKSTSGDVYFDDVRFFPFDASMKSYVYDPVNMRFVAELDERHYTTFYEYDEEGKLLRIKKETERGIMTIQESRNNSVKKGLLFGKMDGCAGAWSLRRVVSGYNGPVVRCKNDAGQERDFYFIGSGLDASLNETELLSFANGGDLRVVTLYDQTEARNLVDAVGLLICQSGVLTKNSSDGQNRLGLFSDSQTASTQRMLKHGSHLTDCSHFTKFAVVQPTTNGSGSGNTSSVMQALEGGNPGAAVFLLGKSGSTVRFGTRPQVTHVVRYTNALSTSGGNWQRRFIYSMELLDAAVGDNLRSRLFRTSGSDLEVLTNLNSTWVDAYNNSGQVVRLAVGAGWSGGGGTYYVDGYFFEKIVFDSNKILSNTERDFIENKQKSFYF